MPSLHYQLLDRYTDEELSCICRCRKIPMPQQWEEGPEGRMRLLKTMIFNLEDNKQLTNSLADLDSQHLKALKHLAEGGEQPEAGYVERLYQMGLMLRGQDGWQVTERVADALADFDDQAFDFQADASVCLMDPPPFAFSLALSSILLRCMGGIRVLKGGLPAKKELGQIMYRNAMLKDERDATLCFALLHRLGLLWSREGRVDTLLPAVISQPPRWVSERVFAKLLEDDLKLWSLPPAEDRRFIMEHLLERKGQTLCVEPFLEFLVALHPLNLDRVRSIFFPFLFRMGILAMDASGLHVSLSEHGEALAQEYLLRDYRGTENHWAPLMEEAPLLIQPTLELMTPMMQNPHRLLRLAQLADVEALDAMVMLRVTPETLVRALDGGLGLDEISMRLGSNLPNTLSQLLADLAHRLGEVEVLQGMRLIRARTSELSHELQLRPEFASLNLKPMSDTLLEANGPGNAFALLKEAGFLPKPGRFLPLSLDGDESLYLWSLACLAFINEKGMNHHLEPIRQMIQGALQRIQAEDPSLYNEIQRRVPMLHLGGGEQAEEETHRIMEYAASYNLMVELAYMPLAAHRSQQRRVTPRMIEGEHLHAFCHLHQEEMSFRLSRIMGVRLLNEKGWSPV